MRSLHILWLTVVGLLNRETLATSLMKRIREKQNSDDSFNTGLDFESDDWIHVPQPVQDMLMSIDDKLRSLDTFSYTLKLARLDFSLDQLVRRMESIETKLGRLETKFDVRMEKVEEVVISKDIKEEFSNEHLSRRMESLNEKINNKAAYLDAKLDVKLERIMSKLDRLQRDLHSAAEDILERLVKNEERQSDFEKEVGKRNDNIDELTDQFQELRLFVKEDLTTSMSNGFQNLKVLVDDVQADTDTIATTCKDLTTVVNNSVTERLDMSVTEIDRLCGRCNHGFPLRSIGDNASDASHLLGNLTATVDMMQRAGEDKYKKLDSDLERYSRKVVNVVEELWKSTNQLKVNVDAVGKSENLTREVIAKELRKLGERLEPVSRMGTETSTFTVGVDKKITELQNSLEDNFTSLLLAQNNFLASCSRIQEEEVHVFDILQQIVYEMRNRSVEDVNKILTELQTQWTGISRSVAYATSAVWMVGNSSALSFQTLQQQHRDPCAFRDSSNGYGNRVIDFLCRPVTSLSNNEPLDDLIHDALLLEEDMVSARDVVRPAANSEAEDFSHEVSDRSRNGNSNETSKFDNNLNRVVKRLGYDDFIKD